MRDLSPFLITSLSAEEGLMFWFLELRFNTVLRYTDCDVDLWDTAMFVSLMTERQEFLVTESNIRLIAEQGYSANKFETMPFKVSPINVSTGGSVDQVRIDIANVDLQMSAVLLNEDIMNRWGTLWVGFFDVNNNLIIDQPIEMFRGLVSTWSLTEAQATITLVNELILWKKRTLRKHQSACRWPFKDPVECKYTGVETWCDQSHARCLALGNVVNYGGFRWLPDLMDRKIWWGKTT